LSASVAFAFYLAVAKRAGERREAAALGKFSGTLGITSAMTPKTSRARNPQTLAKGHPRLLPYRDVLLGNVARFPSRAIPLPRKS
jgi:hypothetical protein